MIPEERLIRLGHVLAPPPRAAALYQLSVLHSGWVYVSGCLPFDTQGQLCHSGKLGRDVSLEAGQVAAQLCAVGVLRVLKDALGSLIRIERVVKLSGFVNCTPEFQDVHLVINGASDLLRQVLGEAGHHARSAVGVTSLPLGASVEVDAVVKLAEETT